MAFLPTNASQVQQFAVALYGIQVGSTTMAAVQADITSIGGLTKALNAYYSVSFGSQTTAAVAASVAANLGLTGTAATDGAAYITAALNAAPASARGQVISDILNLFSTLTANETYGTAATAWNTKVAAAVAYTGAGDSVAGTTVAGSTFVLTTSADMFSPTSSTAANQTTSGNDTVYGTTVASLNSGDVISTGAGTDSLIADFDFGAANAGTATPTTVAPTLVDLENVTVRNTGVRDTQADLFTLNLGNSTGVASVTFDQVAGAGTATTLAATGLAASVKDVGVTSNATLAHNYTFAFADTAVAGAGTALNVNLTANSTATGTVLISGTSSTASGQGVENVTVTTTGTGTAAASTIGTLLSADGGGSTSVLKVLTVKGTSALTVSNSVDFAGTTGATIDATGMSGNLTLTATSGDEPVTFNAAGATGKMTLTTAAGNDNLTGGAGDDTFTIGGGFDTVVGGAGNDRVVISAITDLTANDSITLGDGTADTLAVGTWTSLTSTELTTANKALIAATGAEVLELTAAQGAATTIDFGAVAQNTVRLSGGLAAGAGNSVVSNAATGDNLTITADMVGKTAGATLTASGALPGQNFKVNLFGTGIDLTGVVTAATDHALTISSGISTLTIDSTKAATDTATTANTIGGAIHASAYAIKNDSAASVVITGNQALTIANTTAAGVTFGSAVSVDASAFTGILTLSGSASADVITGGTGNDILTGGAGNDVINLSAGGKDKFVFVHGATNTKAGFDTAAGSDTINDFTGGSGGDLINIAALGAGSISAVTAIVSSAGATAAYADNGVYVLNVSGAAASLTTAGTAAVTDFTNLTQVAAFLSERYSHTSATANEEAVFIMNVGATTYVYNVDSLTTANTTIDAAEISLAGVINRGTSAAIDASNIVFA